MESSILSVNGLVVRQVAGSLDARLKAYIKENNLMSQIAANPNVLVKAQEYADLLDASITQGLADAALPFDVQHEVGTPTAVGDHIEITGQLFHIIRDSWGKAKRAADIVILFNNGYKITQRKLPFKKMDDGSIMFARRKRSGLFFVQSIAASFNSSAPPSVRVEYDPLYDGGSGGGD